MDNFQRAALVGRRDRLHFGVLGLLRALREPSSTLDFLSRNVDMNRTVRYLEAAHLLLPVESAGWNVRSGYAVPNDPLGRATILGFPSHLVVHDPPANVS